MIRLSQVICCALCVCFALVIGTARAAEQVATPEQLEFFEKHVRPLLVEHCLDCHGPDVQEAGLRLDQRSLVMHGIEGHPVVVPGQPDKSRLLAVTRYDGDVQMPPDGKLEEDELAALTTWIRMGLPWPDETGPADTAGGGAIATAPAAERMAQQRAEHWSLQPLVKPQEPSVSQAAWCATPIDRFVLAKLDAAGLAPSPPADRRTLLRRAYFDLIGLPPTAEEVAAFEQDRSPDAFAKVVDRLLASPRYGERWGRHWLDVARYSDTRGYSLRNEPQYPFAYTYRDWVISAFNRDLPYDRFVLEQLAADVLPDRDEKDNSALAALGFLTVGREFSRDHDTLDDRIDVITRGLLGLTVSCARCHDHKYDAIPTDDYYSLYGVLANSVEPAKLPILGEPPDTPEYREYLEELAKREAEVVALREELKQKIAAEVRENIDQYLEAATRLQQGQPLGVGKTADGKPRELRTQIANKWLEVLRRGGPASLFNPWRKLVAIDAKVFAAEAPKQLEALLAASEKAKDAAKKINPLVAEALRKAQLKQRQDLGVIYGRLLVDVQAQWQAALAEAEQKQQAAPTQLDDAAAEEIRALLFAQTDLTAATPDELMRFLDRVERGKLQRTEGKIQQHHANSPGAPPRPMMLVDVEKPADKRVLIRGNPSRPGEVVPRRFLQLLTDGEPKPFTQGSGRLELAQAIVDPANPLTARVIVNRVWMHHFGAPLVLTPSDFGIRSDPPSHPALLDWLAATLVEEGWSLKRLHRAIMLSSVYQQASGERPECAAVDLENRLLWRMNRRRLELEPMRDAMLAVAGRLDEKAGGRPVELWNAPYPTRRTVYGLVDRQDLPGVFHVFDFANPDVSNDQRPRTTVPQQALFAMNSPVVLDMARRLAAREELREQESTSARIEALYRLALARAPRGQEIELAERFIASTESLDPPTPTWQYGYGQLNDEQTALLNFTVLPHWTGERWEGGPKWPDPKLGYVRLAAGGGHPGNKHEHAVVLRWTAPADMAVSLGGQAAHPKPDGDGVHVTIVSSRAGKLGDWVVHNGSAEMKVERVQVQRGETIDYVVDCRTSPSHDTFTWLPQIRTLDGEMQLTWSAARDFRGPLPAPLDAWQMLAQVVLMTNEFMFVD